MTFHMKFLKKLSTMMLQMTRVVSFFMVFHMKSAKTAQYHDATNDYKCQKLSYAFMVFLMKCAKTAQYHDATNENKWQKVFFFMSFPWNSPKQLNTMMLQITHVISCFITLEMTFTKTAQYHDATNDTHCLIFHGTSHEIRNNSSVPWCYNEYKWQKLSYGTTSAQLATRA